MQMELPFERAVWINELPPLFHVSSAGEITMVGEEFARAHERAIRKSIDEIGEEFVALMEALGKGHDFDVAKARMTEAVMWAKKAVSE